MPVRNPFAQRAELGTPSRSSSKITSLYIFPDMNVAAIEFQSLKISER